VSRSGSACREAVAAPACAALAHLFYRSAHPCNEAHRPLRYDRRRRFLAACGALLFKSENIMQIISDDQVRELITMEDAIATIREAFTERGEQQALNQTRVRTLGPQISLGTMGAILPGAGVCGAKVYSTWQGRFDFVIPLFSTGNGELLSVVRGNALTEFRTAAVTRLALDKFGDPEAEVLAVFGTGVQAKSHVRAILAGSKIKTVLIVGIENVDSTIALLQPEFPAVRMMASNTQAALAAADVIVTATRSSEPLFDGTRVKRGAFVAAIGSSKPGAREIDDATLARAHTVIVESREQASMEAGDLLRAAPGVVEWPAIVELAAAAAERPVPGRSGDLTVFKSLGIGVADVALAGLVTRRARIAQGGAPDL
jgi:ornithine cyclodeaminase